MLGIVIPVFNRPEYVSQCFDSLKKADLSKVDIIVIVNDKSTDPRTLELIKQFTLPKAFVINNIRNVGVRNCIQIGMDRCIMAGCDLLINMDSDMIVKPNFIERILKLKAEHPINIISGINCMMLNRFGRERNPL